MKKKQSVIDVLLILVLLAAIAPAYADDNGQPKIHGKTYGEWSAEWWQWAYAGPDGENAVQDTTGAFCAVNQPGNVWFLAGSFGLTGVERTCTIPPNRALFYPLVTTAWTDCPPNPGECPESGSDECRTDAEVRGILTSFAPGGDLSCQLTSTLDGASISSLQILTVRTQSPKFTSKVPENNIVGVVSGCVLPLPPGKTGRQIAEGYWVMLPPLSPGEHVLTLHGSGCGDVFFENGVTYHLTVRP